MNLPLSKSTTLIGLAAALAVLLSVAYLACGSRSSTTFRTVALKRGDLLATISATGTVEPEEVIDIGAQVAGRIVSFGKDKNGKTVDYGSQVEAGTVLARIDDSLYVADVATAKAQLAQNLAGVQNAEANLGQLKAKLFQAERDWARAKKLGPSDALSQADYDAAQSAYESAKANVEVGKAAIVQAKKAVDQAKATLQRAQQNLDYCTITSPVRGVIVDRRVNIGQTVVSSLSAPSLFLLAKDLTRLQVWVSVNEADIGLIHPGQPVTFTVDAFPGEVFKGQVGKVRLNATMTQNVVTYTVEVNTDNSNGKLLPYLTANANFVVGQRQNVLLAPNAALRWAPEQQLIVPEFRGNPKKEKQSKPAGQGQAAAKQGREPERRGVLWIPEGSQVRPVKVRLGLTDGTMTEVSSPQIKDGTLVVTGETLTSAENNKPENEVSPFTPKFFHRSAGAPPKGK